MKMRHLLVATSAALLSFGAIAGGQQQSQSKENTAAPQSSTEATIVRDAQDRLRSQGYPVTPQGLAQFQQANGITPSGTLDEQTLAALGVDASAASGGSSASGASSERAPQGERPTY